MDMDSLKELDLSDVDFNNMGSWPIAGKAFIAALIFSIVIALGVYLFIGDQADSIALAERKEIELKKEFERKQAKAVNLDAYKRQMQTIKDSFQTLLQQLPRADQMAEVIDEISYAATGAGCEVIDLDFIDKKEAEFYSERPIQIQVSGTYHQIADFISRVSRSPRIVTLHDFSLNLINDEVANDSGERALILNILAKTYRADTGEK
jgi:type IV pilus assembly protein PilO